MQIKSRLHKILHGARSSVKKKVLYPGFSRKSEYMHELDAYQMAA